MTTILAVFWWYLLIAGCVSVLVLGRCLLVFAIDALTPTVKPEPPFDWQDIPDLADPLERQWKLPAAEPRGRVR